MPGAGLSDLPVDLFLLICNHLDANSFISLTSTCKSLLNFADEPTVWSRLIRTTFRVANQPVVQHDGARWKKLYRKLKTNTHAYSWGSNSNRCLGQTARLSVPPNRPPGRPGVVSWPEEMDPVDNMGTISEIQCGGWSTSLLTSNGALHVAGKLDNMDHQQVVPQSSFMTLAYPRGFATNHSTYHATTAVRQYHHGRQHLLALSDSGRIWSWSNASVPAYHIKFLHHTTVERQTGRGAVIKVVAGWNKSAALIEGSGIVVWEPVKRRASEDEIEDTVLVQDSELLPETSQDVANFIVLEGYIVFLNVKGRIFSCNIHWDGAERISQPQEILLDASEGKAVDIQGSFRSLAVFTDKGAVLTCNATEGDPFTFHRIRALQQNEVIAVAFGDYHFHALHAPGYITSYGREPETCGAFGLGTSSPEARLRGIRQQGMRGFQRRHGGDGYLVPHAYVQGRRVWFEREKREWIKFLASGGADPGEAVERMRLALGSPDVDAQGEVSEWIEQEGRDWETKLDVRNAAVGDDGLPAYFALTVAAAGWHSAALVLVNDRLAQAMATAVEIKTAPQISRPTQTGYVSGWVQWAYQFGRWFLGVPSSLTDDDESSPVSTERVLSSRDPTAYGAAPRAGSHYIWSEQHFPRLVLADGTEMPGNVPFDEWRYGRPDFEA